MKELKHKSLTEGNMYKAIFSLAIPLMINSLIQTIYNLVDGIWLGQLGATEFAATTFVSPVIFLFVGIGAGVSAAGTSIISQKIGMQKTEDTSSYAYQLFVLAIALGLFISVFGFFLAPTFVSWMGADQNLSQPATTYLSTVILGFPAVLSTFALSSIMQAQGNTRPLTLLSLIAAMVNIILDPILIFETVPFVGLPGLNLGVAGAGLATIISQYINLLLGYWVLKNMSSIKVNFKKEKLDLTKIKNLIRIGIPSITGQTSASFGFIVLNVFISSYGTATLAAYGIVNRSTSMMMQPIMGIGAAIPAIIGQNMGSGNIDRVKECFRKASISSFIISIVGALSMYLFADELILLFINQKDAVAVMPDAIEYIKYSLFIVPLMGGFSIFQGLFQGTGHTKYGMRMSMYRLWVIRIPMIKILQKLTNLGSTGVWISMLVSNFAINIYGYYHYKKEKWKTPVIRD